MYYLRMTHSKGYGLIYIYIYIIVMFRWICTFRSFLDDLKCYGKWCNIWINSYILYWGLRYYIVSRHIHISYSGLRLHKKQYMAAAIKIMRLTETSIFQVLQGLMLYQKIPGIWAIMFQTLNINLSNVYNPWNFMLGLYKMAVIIPCCWNIQYIAFRLNK